MASTLFEDIFDVKALDAEGKKFEKVSRVDARSENYEMDLTLDVHSDLFPLDFGDKFTFALASTLDLSGAPDSGEYNQAKGPTLADSYDYVVYGKVFKYERSSTSAAYVSIYASFGGLLMELKGDPTNVHGVDLDSYIYALMRKV